MEKNMINPDHPVYIVSKGRSDTMITSKSLSRMKVPHYIVIEPQDLKDYDKALDTFNIRDYVTLQVETAERERLLGYRDWETDRKSVV